MATYTLNSEQDLESILAEHDLVLIDFWAPWCPPCKEFHPIFEKVAASHSDVAFCRVNTEEVKSLQKGFELHHIPTLIVIRERIMLTSQAGYLPEEGLEDLITKAMGLDLDALRKDMDDPNKVGK
jgi:thioredoxin 1